MERRRGGNGGSIAWLRGFMLGRGGGRSQGERGVSVSRAERRRRLAISKAKGFQEPKINVNLRPPGRVNRAIMELYTPTHTPTYRQQERTTNTPTHTHTVQGSYTLKASALFSVHTAAGNQREKDEPRKDRKERSKRSKNRQ